MTVERLIDVQHVTKKYQHQVALDNVSLTVAQGETVVLIGPSGCGKSTLCRCMVGLEPLSGGAVRYGGHLFVTAHKRHANRVSFGPKGRLLQLAMGMVFQDFSLFPQMTVNRNITLGPRKVLGRSEREAKGTAAKVLESVGMQAFASSYPEKLSGGQKQRVAIARELAMERQVIYLDEVTSALDPELVHEVLQVIRGLTRLGMTIVMVTHEMSFARSIADRVVFLDAGRIIEQGSPGDIFDNPQHARTKAFLDAVL